MADGTVCPEDENSTDCLLRELLKTIKDKDEEYNWDPLTFGFLVPIGLVAAFFAALTIFQAILSAGSGRRRCNKIAIGRWAKLTQKRWSWQDLTFLTTAKTPLLRSNSILKTLNDNKKGQQSPGDSGHASTDQPSNSTSAATWLRFLQEINLEDLALAGEDENIAETAADYLPSDSLAVPAYGEVGFIVAMAAAAGAYSWKFSSQSPYPVIIGEDFQFDFRQHPTLGTVGAFSRYVQRVAKESPTRECLVKAIKHAKGEIDIATLFPLHDKPRTSLSLEESPVSMNIVELPDFQDLLRCIHREDACTETTRTDLCTLPLYLEGSDEHFLWLFVADTPEHPPAIFPSGLIHVPDLPSILALNSKFWVIEKNTWTIFDAMKERPILPNDLEWKDSSQFIEASPDHRRIFGYKDIYQGCITILYGPRAFQAWFDSKPRSKRQEFRQGVVAQLQQLDKWLQEPGREQDIRCSIVHLCHMTKALLRAENAIKDSSVEASVPADQAGAHPINSGDNLGIDRTDFQSIPDDSCLGIAAKRHSKMLTALRDLVSECSAKGYDAITSEPQVVNFGDGESSKRHVKILTAFRGFGPTFFGLVILTSHDVMLLKTLGKLLDALEVVEERSDKEIIQDAVIWRCILIYLLFWTAPDNSELLSSGLWEHVIPII